MEELNKRYWKGIEELTNDIEFVKNADKEFAQPLPAANAMPLESNRRDFLKTMGFSVAAATIAACNQAPKKYSIPYLNKPENLDPGIPNYYATTYFEGGEYVSILVKTREGRPVKIEGNTLSSITKGKTSVRAQASVLSLYDTYRFQDFQKGKSKADMTVVDNEIKGKLAAVKNGYLLTPSIISPATKALIAEFSEKFGTKHLQYDAISMHGILKANQESFGTAMVPAYDFSKAQVIVGFGCDFLGTWLSPTEFARQYAQNKKVSKTQQTMLRHYQFESRMSLTGANADYRVAVKPSQEAQVLATLYQKITGSGKFGVENVEKILDKAAKELLANKGKSLVVSGSNDPAVQTLVNAINNELGNYGNTIDTTTPYYLYQGNDDLVNAFIDEVKGGNVDAVFFLGVNPVYDHPRGGELANALGKVGLKVSFAYAPDETSVLCDYVCPDTHYLEAWGDAQPKKGVFSLQQPTISPLFRTRAFQDTLLVWLDKKGTFYDYLRAWWTKNVYPSQGKKYNSFEDFWTTVLHDGVLEAKIALKEAKKEDAKEAKAEEKEQKAEAKVTASGFKGDAAAAAAAIAANYKDGGVELTVYPKISMGNGAQANNPWLQEMPDPISKACWGNYVSMPLALAKKLEVSQGDVVEVSAGSTKFELPVLIQPGQANDSVAVALGYGRKVSGKVGLGVDSDGYATANGLGANVFPLNGKPFVSVKLTKTDKSETIAQTQTHQTIMARSIIQEATLGEYQKDAGAGRVHPHVSSADGKIRKPAEISLWKGHQYPNHSWGMVIDLNACIGCGACMIACQAENNVPVVGKKEVLTSREMHWMRIDRYYSSDADPKDYAGLEQASENPEVTFMPMMCQHCNNAPCETVCPVLATTHSTEGLNQMAYNRCIGTRYCANNCPYKVRRFNWFHYAEDYRFTDLNYSQTSDLGRMVLNPDVTVRSRGVMEKCTMCVQRIQAGKLEAKKEKRPVADGEFTTACAQSCPTEAIVFGDMNDTQSLISKTLGITKETKKGEHGHADEVVYKITEPRVYHVLEEINVKPQVSYLTKIRNKDEAKVKAKKHGHGGGNHKENKEKHSEKHS